MENKTDWFVNWFDTPYYHLLYDHRDKNEAEFFMKNLVSFLKLKKDDKVLDLPCGKGRHSLFLNTQGFDVVGADLSKNSINIAKKFENNTLKFTTHDMREPLLRKYNAIFNLFTSFGYFDDDESNIKVLKNFKNGILENGVVVIDFLNIDKAIKDLIPKQQLIKNEITFYIKKYIENDFLIKEISFDADGKTQRFSEKLQCLSLNKMEELVKKSGLRISHTFGNYNLVPFNENTSDRLILILK
jgi:cyclopropane fatty-acyl-phospholipid synthase-like methyltransferase